MTERQSLTRSKLIVDRLAVDDKDSVFWDRDLVWCLVNSHHNLRVFSALRSFFWLVYQYVMHILI